jgi:enoyl-CoA hydratase
VRVQDLRDFLIGPEQLECAAKWRDSAAEWPDRPFGVVDLGSCPRELRIGKLPPYPLIGMGVAADMGVAVHSLGESLDTVIEPPVSVEALARQITRAPRAAAVAVQLLRSLRGLSWDRALEFESLGYGLLQGSDEHARWLAARGAAASTSPAGTLRVERRGAELHLVLDRPQARNAIDCALRDQLYEAFTLAALDPEVRSVKLRAVGEAFCVGGDLEEFGTTRDPVSAHLIRSRCLPAAAIAARASILDVHAQGACIGAGLEIAAFAARFTASPRAWFQLPELAMGLVPGAGGCVSVPARVGRQRAALLILSGRRISAETALSWGLIDMIQDSRE